MDTRKAKTVATRELFVTQQATEKHREKSNKICKEWARPPESGRHRLTAILSLGEEPQGRASTTYSFKQSCIYLGAGRGLTLVAAFHLNTCVITRLLN